MKWLNNIRSRIRANRHDASGTQLARVGKLAEAIEEFRQALEYRKHDGLLRYNLGLALAQSGRVREALEEFRLAMRFGPAHADTYFALATCYAVLGPEWKTALCYRAYLDLALDDAKRQVARERLHTSWQAYQEHDDEQWLRAVRRDFRSNLVKWRKPGALLVQALAQEQPQDTVEKREITSGDWLIQAMEAKHGEWAFAHREAANMLAQRRKYWAALVQAIEGFELYPLRDEAITPLASLCGLVGEPKRAVRLVQAVDRETLSPEQLAVLDDLLATLRDYGHM